MDDMCVYLARRWRYPAAYVFNFHKSFDRLRYQLVGLSEIHDTRQVNVSRVSEIRSSDRKYGIAHGPSFSPILSSIVVL